MRCVGIPLHKRARFFTISGSTPRNIDFRNNQNVTATEIGSCKLVDDMADEGDKDDDCDGNCPAVIMISM